MLYIWCGSFLLLTHLFFFEEYILIINLNNFFSTVFAYVVENDNGAKEINLATITKGVTDIFVCLSLYSLTIYLGSERETGWLKLKGLRRHKRICLTRWTLLSRWVQMPGWNGLRNTVNDWVCSLVDVLEQRTRIVNIKQLSLNMPVKVTLNHTKLNELFWNLTCFNRFTDLNCL